MDSRQLLKVTIFLFSLVITFLLLFHVQVFNGFNILIGDRFDGLIETSILLHWFNFFSGNSTWKEVGYFYPYLNTLGYNDGYFIYGVIYSVFHAIGFDVILSSELVNITLKLIGFLSFYFLCQKCFKLTFGASLCGSVVFTLANGLVYQTGHAQLLSLSFAPLLSLFISKYIESIISNKSLITSVLYGSICAIFYCSWLLTTFYMAWFYTFFALILTAFYLAYSILYNKTLFLEKIRKINVTALIIPFIILIVSLIPFLMVYLPKVKETGGHGAGEILMHAPVFWNILDPGSGNYIFGSLSDTIFGGMPGLNREGEFRVGFPPFILLVLLLTLFVPWKKYKDSNGVLLSLLAKFLAFGILLSFVLVIRINDFTLWSYIWKVVPGAKGLRVTARYLLFIIFPLSLLVALLISNLQRMEKYGFIISIFALILVAEQINFMPNQGLNRKKELSFINSIPKPPLSCTSFFVTGQRKDEFPFPVDASNAILNLYPHNVDAMFLSEFFALRTFNGFSTFNPPDWSFQITPYDTYLGRVFTYAENHQINSGVCELDLYNLSWNEDVLNHKERLLKISPGDLTLTVLKPPRLSADKKTWIINIKVKSNAAQPIGLGTSVPINLGLRELNDDMSIKRQDFIAVPLPKITHDEPEVVVTIEIPVQMLTTSYIDVLPVRQSVAWLDKIGLKPIVIHL